MKITEMVKQLLTTEGRWNILATSDKTGKPNIANFGSVQLVGDSSIAVMLGDNRSYANLKENPYAAAIVIPYGESGMGAKGCRLYLKVQSMQDKGREWEECKARVQAKIGKAAEILKHYVCFDILEARPILDFGQGI